MSTTTSEQPLPGAELPAARMPGHWLLARLGKRVLRPGGVELTRRMLSGLHIGSADDVLELAPGLGATTQLVLERSPASYVAVERDPDAAERVRELVAGPEREVVQGTAAATGRADASASVVFGEAYLTMHPDSQKRKIVAELARVLRPGGRLGLHEVAVRPDPATGEVPEAVARDLTGSIKVNVSPMTLDGWRALLTEAGLRVTDQQLAPLHLLEPRRFVADEGIAGTLRFVRNVLADREARSRVLAMRSSMRRHASHLDACVIVAEKR